MAINPINGISVPSTPTPTPAVKPTQGEQKVNFNEALDSAINKVNNDQQSLGVAIEDLLAGRTQDVVPALTEKEPAEPVHVAFAWKRRLGRRPETAGILRSPQRMRLTDFSGMGERAPPVER